MQSARVMLTLSETLREEFGERSVAVIRRESMNPQIILSFKFVLDSGNSYAQHPLSVTFAGRRLLASSTSGIPEVIAIRAMTYGDLTPSQLTALARVDRASGNLLSNALRNGAGSGELPELAGQIDLALNGILAGEGPIQEGDRT